MTGSLRDLILRNRSTRRFDESRPVALATLRELVDLARLSASSGNLQPLKFLVSCDPAMNARIFPQLRWAAYLVGWPGPAPGERPAAYVLILWDNDVQPSRPSSDPGIAAQSIMLGAVERGLAGCMIGSIDADGLRRTLRLQERFEIPLALALGAPAEEVHVEELLPGGDHRYWRDEAGVHHVPKRKLDDLIVEAYGE